MALLERTGSRNRAGLYIPPHRLHEVEFNNDPNSKEYQQRAWEDLRRGINGIVNKVSSTNIVELLPDLFSENLVRGRGLLCRALTKAQMSSPGYTNVYAALIAVVNTKLPEIGELLLKRVIVQFRKAYLKNSKIAAVSSAKFIAHLVNQQVAHEILALQLLSLLLENVSNDSVEVAVNFVKECGAILTDLSPTGLNAAFDRFRIILQEGLVDKRVQHLIEDLFTVRRHKFADYPAIISSLDLVETEDQITHEVGLDDEDLDLELSLDLWSYDENFIANEKAWQVIKKEIIGEEEEEEGEYENGGGSDKARAGEDLDIYEGEEEYDGAAVVDTEEVERSAAAAERDVADEYDISGAGEDIVDLSETDLVNLRRTIYLTIMSSLDFEECAHKLMKLNIPKSAAGELANMLVECCSQERTFLRYFGLLGSRFCMISPHYQEAFEENFAQQYATIHRLETNKSRNVAKFFAHLLHTDSLPWTVLSYIRLTEEDTSSASRIFLKFLFQVRFLLWFPSSPLHCPYLITSLLQELAEYMGLVKLRERLCDESMQVVFSGIFPRDNLRNTRFSINFFTSIGLGALTDDLRAFLRAKTAENAAAVQSLLS